MLICSAACFLGCELQVPASFTLQLKKGNLDIGLNQNRRLLNTEKLIFKTENLDVLNDQVQKYP